MTAKVVVTPKTRRVLARLPDHTRMHRRGIVQALHEVGQLDVNEVRRLVRTGTRTGRVYVRRGRRHQASAPTEIPANDTGALADSAGYRVHSWRQMEFGEEVNYAKFLEEGTRRMRPRPHLVVTVNNTAGDALRAFYRYGAREIGAGRRGR